MSNNRLPRFKRENSENFGLFPFKINVTSSFSRSLLQKRFGKKGFFSGPRTVSFFTSYVLVNHRAHHHHRRRGRRGRHLARPRSAKVARNGQSTNHFRVPDLIIIYSLHSQQKWTQPKKRVEKSMFSDRKPRDLSPKNLIKNAETLIFQSNLVPLGSTQVGN